MEQSAETGVPMVPVVENKQKSGNGLRIATAIACIVAVCGIGFGIYNMIQSSRKNNRVSDLEIQIKDLNDKISLLEIDDIDSENVTDEKEGDSTVIIDSNSKDYLYVYDELMGGLKIKKPELRIVDNRTQDGSIVGISYAVNGLDLYVWGTVYRDGDQAAKGGVFYAHDGQIGSPYLIKIDTSYTDKCPEGEKFGELDNNSLCYVETSSDVLTNTFDDNTMERYVKPTIEILREHFTNINNYSKF